MRVGKEVGRYKMAKHFEIRITETELTYERKNDAIAEEAALDGIYVIRTDLPQEEMSVDEAVTTYKRLSVVERAFRCMKSMDLKVRPIHHRKEERVRAHVFVCMLAYYVEWHMRSALAPMLFEDDDKAGARVERTSTGGEGKRSRSALAKAATKRTSEGGPCPQLPDGACRSGHHRAQPRAPPRRTGGCLRHGDHSDAGSAPSLRPAGREPDRVARTAQHRIRNIGVDEFSYRKRHRYLTTVVDHDRRRVVWAAPGHSSDTLGAFFDELGEERCAKIECVTMDMAGGYIKAVEERLPEAQIVFDRFHVQRLVSDALDEVRRAQLREIRGTDEGRELFRSRFALLKNPGTSRARRNRSSARCSVPTR